MRIVWNEQTAGWFRRASEYTGYNKKMAELLLRHIPLRDTLCDIGCGAGLVDVELSPHIGRITCVDRDHGAVQAAEDNLRRYQVNNVTAVCADAGSLTGQWDTVIALFFGGMDCVPRLLPLARDRFILAAHEELLGSIGPKEHKVPRRSNVQRLKGYLDSLGVRYHLERAALEYGQPFVDMAEARAFIRAYTTPMSAQALEEYLSQRLERTGDPGFPLYLPNQKRFGIFVIRRDENGGRVSCPRGEALPPAPGSAGP